MRLCIEQPSPRAGQRAVLLEQRRADLSGAIRDLRDAIGTRTQDGIAYLAGVDRHDMHHAISGSRRAGITRMEAIVDRLLEVRAAGGITQ